MKDNHDRHNRVLPITLIIAAVLTASLVYWQWQRRESPSITPEKEAVVVAIPETPPVPPDNPVEPMDSQVAPPAKPDPIARLPQLDRSDPDVISHLLEVSDGAFQTWLIQEHLIRKFVRAVNALEEGKLVSQYRPFTPPESPFSALQAGEIWQVQPENYQRYTPYLESLEKVGPEGLARLYHHYFPLLQQAYEELGVDKGNFREVTMRALTRISKAPIPPSNTPLARPSVTYKFAAPELEQRSQVEKLLFRLGPENSVRLKKLAGELLAELQRT